MTIELRAELSAKTSSGGFARYNFMIKVEYF